MKIGVLALQGAVREHLRMLERAGAEATAVKRPEQLAGLDGSSSAANRRQSAS